MRATILLAGLAATQILLIGPSLAGFKILLPLDILAQPRCFIHSDIAPLSSSPMDHTLSDQIYQFELFRQFATEQVRAGRLPLWNPYSFAGYPFIAANQTAVFSPLRVLDYLWPSPMAIAWGRLLRMVLAGMGAYLLFRRSLKVKFWPAVIGAWAYPLTGFFLFWANFPQSDAVICLPWLLLATERSVHRPLSGWPLVLALITASAMLTGHAATAAQTFVGTGIFFLWRLKVTYTLAGLFSWRCAGTAAIIAGAWLLGICLSMPQNLPTYEYLQTSFRVEARIEGYQDFKPQGLSSIFRLLVPYCDGNTKRATSPINKGLNLPEGVSAGYAGLTTLLLAAPLGFMYKRRRGAQWFFLILSTFGIGYLLNLAPIVWLMRQAPLNLLQVNRFSLLTGLGVLTMGVLGLDALIRRPFHWRRWLWIWVLLVGVVGVWCAHRAFQIHAIRLDVLERIQSIDDHSKMFSVQLPDLEAVKQAGTWFVHVHIIGAVFCAAVAILWLMLRKQNIARTQLFAAIAALILLELVMFSWHALPQNDPGLYYPKRPLLAQLTGKPGRVCGYRCMWPNLSQVHQLRDIRGYDGADPIRYIELLSLAAADTDRTPIPYAYAMTYRPKLSPITRLLGLRYLIIPGKPPPGSRILFYDSEWSVVELPDAIPRAFVPKQVMVVDDRQDRLRYLANPNFDPGSHAIIESIGLDRVNVGSIPQKGIVGRADITLDQPSKITIDVDMKTPGLVVLTDRWDDGWRATIDGKPAPVLRVNHALRGVIAPVGKHQIEYVYWPDSFASGLKIMAMAAIVFILWLGGVTIRNRRLAASKH